MSRPSLDREDSKVTKSDAAQHGSRRSNRGAFALIASLTVLMVIGGGWEVVSSLALAQASAARGQSFQRTAVDQPAQARRAGRD
jgi:hypothetical protein